MRERRLLESQNERLLAEIVRLRRDLRQIDRREQAVQDMIANWQGSRAFFIAKEMSTILRGTLRERVAATGRVSRRVGRAAALGLLRRLLGDVLARISPPALPDESAAKLAEAKQVWEQLWDRAVDPSAKRALEARDAATPLRIALVASGGVGDVLKSGVVAAALKQSFAPCQVSLFHTNARAPSALAGNSNLEHVHSFGIDLRQMLEAFTTLPLFDLVVDFRYVVRYLLPIESRLDDGPGKERLLSASLFVRPWLDFLQSFPETNNQFGRAAQRAGAGILDLAGMSGALDISQRSSIPFFPDEASLGIVGGLIPEPYVTVHHGVDENWSIAKPSGAVDYDATKMLPVRTWSKVIAMLRRAGLAVVQLGTQRESPLPGVTHDLRGLTSLSEVALIIKQAVCHIDTEGGLVHLARAVNRRSVVLFGPTPAGFFGYPQNVNLSPETCSDCWWITPQWLGRCHRETAGPECMLEHKPETIVDAALQIAEAARKPVCRIEHAALFSGADHWRMEPTLRRVLKAPGLGYPGLPAEASASEPPFCVSNSNHWEYPFAFEAIRRFGPATLRDQRVADVGGGRSAFAFALGRMGADVDAFDPSFLCDPADPPDVADRFIVAFRQVGHARFGSLANLPADDESYDVVSCLGALDQAPHKREALRELLRILRPGGLLALTFGIADEPRLDSAERGGAWQLADLAVELDVLGATEAPYDGAAVRQSACELADNPFFDVAEGSTIGGVILRKLPARDGAPNGV